MLRRPGTNKKNYQSRNHKSTSMDEKKMPRRGYIIAYGILAFFVVASLVFCISVSIHVLLRPPGRGPDVEGTLPVRGDVGDSHVAGNGETAGGPVEMAATGATDPRDMDPGVLAVAHDTEIHVCINDSKRLTVVFQGRHLLIRSIIAPEGSTLVIVGYGGRVELPSGGVDVHVVACDIELLLNQGMVVSSGLDASKCDVIVTGVLVVDGSDLVLDTSALKCDGLRLTDGDLTLRHSTLNCRSSVLSTGCLHAHGSTVVGEISIQRGGEASLHMTDTRFMGDVDVGVGSLSCSTVERCFFGGCLRVKLDTMRNCSFATNIVSGQLSLTACDIDTATFVFCVFSNGVKIVGLKLTGYVFKYNTMQYAGANTIYYQDGADVIVGENIGDVNQVRLDKTQLSSSDIDTDI